MFLAQVGRTLRKSQYCYKKLRTGWEWVSVERCPQESPLNDNIDERVSAVTEFRIWWCFNLVLIFWLWVYGDAAQGVGMVHCVLGETRPMKERE